MQNSMLQTGCGSFMLLYFRDMLVYSPVLNPVPMLLTWPGCGNERTHEFAEPPRAQAWRLETLAASYFSHSSGACTGSACAPRERHCPWEPSPSGGVRSRLHWVALSKRGAALSQESLDNSQQHARDADVLDCVAIGTGEEFQCQLASQVPSFKILPKDRRSGGEEGGQALRQRVDLADSAGPAPETAMLSFSRAYAGQL
jgi:hypothetical protein